ncbi:hypothetical protein RHECNPAF_4310039 [Rhizobium etli CNPAF512]|nr:hypothetical protein RHECNPAF_4310039 [Rhizobium etli CNPAF512]
MSGSSRNVSKCSRVRTGSSRRSFHQDVMKLLVPDRLSTTKRN